MSSWRMLAKAVLPPSAALLCTSAQKQDGRWRFTYGAAPVKCDAGAPLGKHRGSRQQYEGIKLFREKLKKGETVLGVGIQFTDPMSTDAMADCSDFLWYDTEHYPVSPEVLKWHLMVAHGKGCPCLVRVPGPNRVDGVARPWGMFIKHALDMNADGIVVPQIRTADDVRSIVADCRYPTGGQRPPPYDKAEPSTMEMPNRRSRGFGPTVSVNYGRIGMNEYLKACDENIFVAVMIETVEALENIDEICSVPGLDCVVLGANDLSAALGVPYKNEAPETLAAADKIIATAKKHGKAIFFSTRYPEMAKKMAAKGVQILHIGHDVLAAVAYQESLVAQLKGPGYIPR
eukprot:TRINITY_DN102093_c0_g1_i1.p2 TRINITY_DN102093_c0_g1~~TRINITY_DN102093_c0_g1_i1.p2  ORF type:complete len:345 (-),score=89.60 TRINITY_DN102093_c0_g1_i1:200-1234(-)